MTEVVELTPEDLAIDHALAQLSASLRFLLEVTPVDAASARAAYDEKRSGDPVFTYRELQIDPEVAGAQLAAIDVSAVENPTLGHLLRAKHRELELQLAMLAARDSEDFLALSIELYGGVAPALREQAEAVLGSVRHTESAGEALDAESFLELALAEVARYREQDPDIEMHAEIRPDASGVLVSGNSLLIGPESVVQARRAEALIHHEVGTHLVTQVNGSAQPIKVLGSGLAGYDETQEGLAVLAEILSGGLTAFRLRQLAARVLTVHRRIGGASFREAHDALVDEGFPEHSAFTTVMRIFRAGGMTKDAIYLRGLVDLLGHLRGGGRLDLLCRGKFALRDLPLIEDLDAAGILRPARLIPRYLLDPAAADRLAAAAQADDLGQLLEVPV
ncbi:flavohemoglobin expression-modulating QEGLA motif protein [Nostocoides jenkinsii]|uniref:DUF1704 domain-containing protein n=1 Tax=Nostocoides jenkinsii Ben 74 TaxID=1193518 RepID=A0A077MDG8_9MICO|nr:tyrosine/phenylalanine carboxypeptidase domain-containing protein [Tetrasphaera jenkinsii]CCI52907.1 conserved hypothetical protein [Tetrasphaera jenkinsii Ben 74]